MTNHLYYANALYINLPDVNINKLQRIQNIAAKLVLGACKYDSATECIHYLHWLPIRKRIQLKLLLLIFKAIYNIVLKIGPPYIKDMFELYGKDQRILRSNSILYHNKMPSTKKSTFARWTLTITGTRWWNDIPNCLKTCKTIIGFKTALKHIYISTT